MQGPCPAGPQPSSHGSHTHSPTLGPSRPGTLLLSRLSQAQFCHLPFILFPHFFPSPLFLICSTAVSRAQSPLRPQSILRFLVCGVLFGSLFSREVLGSKRWSEPSGKSSTGASPACCERAGRGTCWDGGFVLPFLIRGRELRGPVQRERLSCPAWSPACLGPWNKCRLSSLGFQVGVQAPSALCEFAQGTGGDGGCRPAQDTATSGDSCILQNSQGLRNTRGVTSGLPQKRMGKWLEARIAEKSVEYWGDQNRFLQSTEVCE